ncbi:DUF4214 domain-containing protein [Pseudomonas kurunegalensis]|uniref:DUF4214 domain-containing protein n=1 Tax=Pseudomonas kurunegalensis TaxID=485880 RepID=UPI00211797E7|nr:DUF4214 domain-containing protein [Pseudomonas kurunegalensis]
MAITSAQVQQLYVAYLGRAADKAGLDYWLGELNATPATITLEQVRANFVNEQAEYKEVYAGLSRVDTVTKIYNNLFNRAPDADGLTYWTTGGGASVSADQLLIAFINGAAATDAQTVTNKVLVSEIYTSTAGSNFVAADAKEIISGVTDNASISTALGKLTNGSLSGIAVPAAVAALKADIAADAAVTSFETNNVTTLKALNDELVALSVTNDTAGLIGNYTSSTQTTYGGLSGDIEAGITAARGSLDTEALTTAVAKDTTDLATARTAFLTEKGTTNAVDSIAAYEAAVKAVAANKGAVDSDLTQAEATFSAYASNSSNATQFKAALTAAGLADTTTAADIATALKSAATTDAQVKKITDAFASVSAFASLKTQAGLERAEAVAVADKAAAEKNLTTDAGKDWKKALDKLNTDTASLNASKAVDAFEAKYKVTDTAHDALVSTATETQAAVTANKSLVLTTAGGVVDANKAEVFYFNGAVTTANDATINFDAKDSLYIGDGYTLNTSATLTSTGITGGNNSALEVFFFKDATSGTVKAVVETAAEGNTTLTDNTLAASTTDKVAIITLSGVTDVSQVQFANGVISHVA